MATRHRTNNHARSVMLAVAFALAWSNLAVGQTPSTRPVQGLRDNTPRIHAIYGARVVPRPGTVWERATIVVRDGVIVEAGPAVAVPPDARLWDLGGKTVYAGLVDALSLGDEADYRAATERIRAQGASHWNDRVIPQIGMAGIFRVQPERNKAFRSQGITLRLVAPPSGIIRGTSALVTTGDGGGPTTIVVPQVAQHVELTVAPDFPGERYPNSPMGAVALARQAMLDATWYADAWRAHRVDSRITRPERNDALAALAPVVAGELPVIIHTSDEQYLLRADRFAREFGLQAIFCGSGHEYRALGGVLKTGRAVIVPVHYPKPPNVGTPEAAREVSLEALMHWDLAPENAGRLEQGGVKILLSTLRLESPGDFLPGVRKAVRRGLSREGALAAMTTVPAELYGVADRAGTIEPGKAAHLVVTDGDLFDDDTRVLETWVDGVRYEVSESPRVDLRGTWGVSITSDDGTTVSLTLAVRGKPGSLEASMRQGSKEIAWKHLTLVDTRLAGAFSGDELGRGGIARFGGIVTGSAGKPVSWLGSGDWADGTRFTLTAEPSGETSGQGAEDSERDGRGAAEARETAPDGQDGPQSRQGPGREEEPTRALFEPNYPLGDYGREGRPDQAAAVAFTHATVWTCGPAGILEDATVLVRDGKIAEVGRKVDVPPEAMVIDVRGHHITPGIIDCHSHIATDGGINESGQSITAEVRIGDFIDAYDINIYRQLAGGVTCANILHGSANPIGGQNQVIKLRWGALAEELRFGQAPPGIKFALGENVKQSNWGDRFTSRYPQTRMGVQQIIEDAFYAARDYELRWRQWRDRKEGLPPRRDLELDTLVEVLRGERLIHCHSYRQDEILALLRTCEKFGVTVATLQHILEGYKVAEVMRQLGVAGSSFSDWWAYKFEVYDAIPYNGALMHRVGVNVSFNSDDAELARRLNGEAAKAIKYGRIPPEEAIKFVTLNPARQLRIDAFVGSLEPGKDADLAVWSGPPLSSLSRCEQTWIDGRRYFDRHEDQRAQETQRHIRSALIQRILNSGVPMKKPGEMDGTEKPAWTRVDQFCVTRQLELDGESAN